MSPRLLGLIVGCLTGLVLAAPCSGEGGIPADALAWWRLAPPDFDASEQGPGRAANSDAARQALLATLRAAVSSGLLGSETPAQIGEGLLAAAEIGPRGHTLCLLDLEAARRVDGTGMVPDLLQMVLAIDGPGDHSRYVRTIEAIALKGAASKGLEDSAQARQRVIDLPGGRRGVGLRFESWPEWRQLSWHSGEDGFVIGLGPESLERWYTAGDDGDAPRWGTHRDARAEMTTNRRDHVFLEAYCDLDGLRTRFPSAFAYGRTPRLLKSLGLTGSRSLMVHGVLTRVAGDRRVMAWFIATVEREGGAIESFRLGERNWNEERTGLPMPAATFGFCARANWRTAFELGLKLHEATIPDSHLPRFRDRLARWRERHQAHLDELLDGLDPYMALADYPRPPIPAPGLCTVYARADDGMSTARLRALMTEVLRAFSGAVGRDDAGVWSLRVDPAGIIRIPAWGVLQGPGERAMVVGGWGPPVVNTNERWFEQLRTDALVPSADP